MQTFKKVLKTQTYKPTSYLTLTIILLIAILLASRPIGLGLDDENYLDYFRNTQEILSHYDGYSLIFNEPLWLFFCYLANVLLGSEGGLRSAIFFGAAFAGIGLARINRWYLLPVIFYFALPMSLKNHIDHLRQGFALGLYILFISVPAGRWRVLRFASPFVHSSFWIIILIEVLLASYLKKNPARTYGEALIVFFVFAGVSVVLSLVMWQAADMLGVRQTKAYQLFDVEVSGAGFAIFVLLIPILVVLMNRKYLVEFFAFLGVYLGSYYINPFAARIFENSYYLLLSGASTESSIKRFLFWILLLIMCIIFGINGNLYSRLLGLSTS
jgi:hypothetical protein